VSTDPVRQGFHDILADMYGLTPEQCEWYDRFHALVHEALEQFDQGYAVNVEQQMADLAKEVCP
jgi:hypothetical protein